jgi:hydrogenase expression/formation protein HypC
MCLAVPARLIQCEGSSGLADLHGTVLPVSTALLPDSRAGDWVLIHAGFAIQRLSQDEAVETWGILRESAMLPGESE